MFLRRDNIKEASSQSIKAGGINAVATNYRLN